MEAVGSLRLTYNQLELIPDFTWRHFSGHKLLISRIIIVLKNLESFGNELVNKTSIIQKIKSMY